MKPPYYAVIFASELQPGQDGYEAMTEKMVSMVKLQPGFLGFDSTRGKEGLGITISYWESMEAIRRWKAVAEHLEAQALGRDQWYSRYRVRISQVLEEYGS